MSTNTIDGKRTHLGKVKHIFWRIVEAIALGCFGIMFMVMLLQVLTRYVLKINMPWTDEAARFLFIWSLFLGAAIAQRANTHIRVTFLVDRLNDRIKNLFFIVSDLISVVISLIIFYGTILMMKKTFGVLASSIPISYTWIYLSLALGISIIVILLASDIVKKIV